MRFIVLAREGLHFQQGGPERLLSAAPAFQGLAIRGVARIIARWDAGNLLTDRLVSDVWRLRPVLVKDVMSHADISKSDRPEGPQRKKRLDQQTVISVAVRLFNQHGYDRTSMNEIAADLGITKAALYYHFESKEDILLTGVTQASERLDLVLGSSAAPEGSARQQVGEFMRAYSLALRDPTFRCLIQADERVLGPLGQAKVRDCKRRKQHLLEDLLAATGAPRQDVRAMALAVFGALNWSAMSIADQASKDLDAVSDVVMGWLDQSIGIS